jgi:hypothetical protein
MSLAAAVASIVLALGGPTAQGTAAATAGPCDVLRSGIALQLDLRRIGPFPAAATLDSLRRLCPSAQPTMGHGFETGWAALDLSIGGLGILAGQNWLHKPLVDAPEVPDPVVDWSRAPSHWVVRGCGALLPRGVSSCGTWADLTAAFGAVGSADASFGPVVVSLAELPGFSLELDVTDETVGSIEVHGHLTRIPPTARVVAIVIATP